MRYFIYILWVLLLTSCSTYQFSTYNHTPVRTSNKITLDVIDTEYSLQRKFDRDSKFRWNFAQYAMDQDLSWYYSFYNRNRLFRYNFNLTPWDLYVNKYDFWFDWNFNYNFRSYRFWNPYRYNSWGWNSWNPYYSNFHIWNREHIAYSKTRRGSTGVIVNNNKKRRLPSLPEKIDNKLRRSVNILKGKNSNIRTRNYSNIPSGNSNKIVPRLNPNSNSLNIITRRSISTRPNNIKPQTRPNIQSPSIKSNNSSSRGIRSNINRKN